MSSGRAGEIDRRPLALARLVPSPFTDTILYLPGSRCPDTMSTESPTATCQRFTAFDAADPTLIEGLPGHGLVASIAVDRISEQLGLEHHGIIRSDAFPQVTSFEDGLVQDTVRIYAGDDPPVMTLESDVPIPTAAAPALSDCVIEEFAETFSHAIFLAAAPAQSEDQLGTVLGLGTDPRMQEELVTAGVDIADGTGVVGGVTGALVNACYKAEVPAILLLVRADPHVPDPGAARAVIETALEPLVEFEIDTGPLDDQTERIQAKKAQVAQELQAAQEAEGPVSMQARAMYQ